MTTHRALERHFSGASKIWCFLNVAASIKTAWVTRLLLLLLLLTLPAVVQAQSYTNSNGIVYTVSNGAITIAGYVGSGGAVTIPSTILVNNVSLPVTSIGEFAFDGCSSLTSVTIPNSVTSFGEGAFANCTSLTNVTIGNSVTSIGYATFYGCYSLTSVTIPNSVTSIGYEAFVSCTSLTNMTIGNSVTSIGDDAFNDCTSLTSVTIPNSVTNIQDYAFMSCSNLTSVYFGGNAPSLGANVFSNDNNATVYYLPGTTGWGSTFGGLPTAQWLNNQGTTYFFFYPTSGDLSATGSLILNTALPLSEQSPLAGSYFEVPDAWDVDIPMYPPNPPYFSVGPADYVNGSPQLSGAIAYVPNYDQPQVFFYPTTAAQSWSIYMGADSEVAQGTGFWISAQQKPVISAQPQSQTVAVGQSATFTVSVLSDAPFYYQWQFNGTNLLVGTNSLFAISSVQLTDAGSYSVVVTNAFGSTTSSVAILQVLPPGAPSIQINGQLAVGTVLAIGSAQLTISGGFFNGFIFYTLDGNIPTTSSPLYTGPITLTNSAMIHAMSVSEDFSQSAQAPAVVVQIIPIYNLQTAVVGGGTISVSPASGPYPSNSVVVLTATAATYWAFDHWTGDVTGNQNPASLTMNGPRSVQAVFVPTAYPLTVSTPGGGSVTVNGQTIPAATYYSVGSVVTLTAAASTGWSFLGWQSDASGTNNPLSLTMNQTNNIQGIFGTAVGTNAVGGGGVVLSQPNPIAFGATVTASAVPNSGEYFVTWSGAASGTNSPTTITVTTATPTVDALFTTLPGGKYALSVVVNGSGTVTVSPQQNYYNPGSTVTLSAATTNAGFNFYGWTQGATGIANPLTVVVTSNTVIQANFVGFPTVNVSPQNLIVLAGSNAVLTANAAGLPPLMYQWQNSAGWIVGATNSIYTIVNAQATNSGNYFVIVSNPFGSVTSAVAAVTVVFPPSIAVQPLSQAVAAGTPVTLSVSASGTMPLSYQWWNSAGAIPTATNASYTLNPAETNDWDNYAVVVSNAYGAATSSVATLVVYLPVSIINQPASQIVPDRSTVTFGVTAGGYPVPSYQWAFNGTNLPGATLSTLTITNVLLPNMGSYAVLVGNGYSSQLSATATLSMSPSITAPFIGATTIWGKSAVLSVGAIGSGELSYQWYLNGVAIGGATSATLNFTSIQLTNAGVYSVVVSSPFGTITNVAAQVVVNPAGLSLGFSPTLTINGVAGYSYIIQSSVDLTDTNAWVTLTNLTLTQPVQLWVDTNVDATLPANPQVFYRVLPGQ